MPTNPLNVSERRKQPPTVAVSAVLFALHPLAGPAVGSTHHWHTGADTPTGKGSLSSTDTTNRPALAHSYTPVDDGPAALWVPLVRRTRPPYAGLWALPGGELEWDKSLTEAAADTLSTISTAAPGYLEQLATFGDPERSASALRQVTIAYWSLLGTSDGASAAPAENLAWFRADHLPEMAFDHEQIVQVALERLRSRTTYADIAARFLGSEFTLAELHSVYDAVLGDPSDLANFRRRMLASGQLQAAEGKRKVGAHRPAQLYRFVTRLA